MARELLSPATVQSAAADAAHQSFDSDRLHFNETVELMETIDLEREVVGLLTELSVAQDELLDLLGEKRRLILASNAAAIDGLAPREQALFERLQDCHERRCALVAPRLSHQNLANWAMIQRTLLHLSQLMEMVVKVDVKSP
jgi:hypothetical protein